MTYNSINEVQNFLANNFFYRTKDSKKAAGRALGTFVEIITYYLLRTWGFQKELSIETRLPEYGNNDLTHNVEFTLHNINRTWSSDIDLFSKMSTKKLIKINNLENITASSTKNVIDIRDGFTFIKNGAILGENTDTIFIVYVDSESKKIEYSELVKKAHAMFECKRVGMEGDSKGPQTIEKAKQGAYVARTVSSLQRIYQKGKQLGIIQVDDEYIIDDYYKIFNDIVNRSINYVEDFCMTVGIVSNHGNWFTSGNQNKELKVLAQSYDWLLFLTDDGLTTFIKDIFEIDACKNAFIYSYSLNENTGRKNVNIFTKSNMELESDKAIRQYFDKNIDIIESWFNILSPENTNIESLKEQLKKIRGL